ncbi:acyloxyacyl hydrolase [Octadecabacter sp.]|nr:acyloxyacyl hydrolase [Octadecabacter sp.]
MSNLRAPFFAITLSVLAVPVTAQEFTYGVGFADFQESDGQDTGVFDLEYRHKPFFQRGRFSSAIGANTSITAEVDAFAGIGLWNRVQFENGMFFESSIMPGLYEEGTSDNDLGSTFVFRGQGALGYTFDGGRAISAAVSRKSNFNFGDGDQTQLTYSIRYRIPL